MKKMEQTGKNVSPYSNEARNRYVVEGITNSMLKFLKDRPIAEISISEICQDAAVGRTSFYRNFETKEDIIKNHIRTLMTRWQEAYEADSRGSNAELYGSLFAYLKEHDDFFLLLKKRGLLYLFLEVYKERNGDTFLPVCSIFFICIDLYMLCCYICCIETFVTSMI